MENEECSEGQTTTINILVSTFLYRKIYIVFEKIVWKNRAYTITFLRFHLSQKALQSPVLFFLFPFTYSIFGQTGNSFLPMFHKLLPTTHVTSTAIISLDTLDNVTVENVPLI